jgi:hypothetical protein
VWLSAAGSAGEERLLAERQSCRKKPGRLRGVTCTVCLAVDRLPHLIIDMRRISLRTCEKFRPVILACVCTQADVRAGQQEGAWFAVHMLRCILTARKCVLGMQQGVQLPASGLLRLAWRPLVVPAHQVDRCCCAPQLHMPAPTAGSCRCCCCARTLT